MKAPKYGIPKCYKEESTVKDQVVEKYVFLDGKNIKERNYFNSIEAAKEYDYYYLGIACVVYLEEGNNIFLILSNKKTKSKNSEPNFSLLF